MGDIRVAKSVYRRNAAKRVCGIVGIALLALVVVYLCFAATIIRFLPTTKGPVAVKNATFDGGIAPQGSTVVINTASPVKDDIGSHMLQALTLQNNVATVKVEAGPTGKINSRLIGSPGGKFGAVDVDGVFLKNQYVVTCLDGCDGSEIVDAHQIYGEPLE